MYPQLPKEGAPKKRQIPCRFFARGFCLRGTGCIFGHEVTDPSSVESEPSREDGTTTSTINPISRIPCRFLAAGHCSRGSSCSFRHEEEAGLKSTAAPAVDQAWDSRSRIPCQFFAKGACRNGDTCPFAHCGPDEKDKVAGEEEVGQAKESTPDDWTREIGGALVTFCDGAAISKLSLPSDFSAVRLNGLPLDSTPPTVASLILDTTGIQVTEEHVVRIVTLSSGTECSADVKKEDPKFATTLCDKMKSKSLANEVARFEATPITLSIPRGATYLHRVDCKKVQCSWDRPTRTAELYFTSEDAARQVQERFNAGLYKVLGANITASDETETDEISSWTRIWTVNLIDLPGNARKKNISKSIHEHIRPDHIELQRPNYEADPEFDNAIVMSMLIQFGPLEWWEATGKPVANKNQAQARFTEESHAREAVERLNNEPLSFSNTTRLNVQLVTSAKFKVPTSIYDAVQDQLDSEIAEWEKRHIQFIAYPPIQGYRVLKLDGEDGKFVAQAKETLGRIVGGEVAAQNGKHLWHPGLGKDNGHELQKVKLIEQFCRVVVLLDKRKFQIRLFGPEDGRKKANEILAAFIQELEKAHPSKGRVIELDAETFQWVCRGGLTVLVSLLGDNKVTLDVVSMPRRLIVYGSGDDYRAALAIISSESKVQQTLDCSVCWTEAENPIRTSCNHVYCMACFTDLSQAPASSTANEFCISCVGGGGLCKKVLSLSELHSHLSSTAFEDLLESSFASYMRSHHETLRYCPTPDCGQVYRSTATATMTLDKTFTCPNCLFQTCTSCHAPHPGMTCEVHKDLASGGYEALERAKKEIGIKDCPKCTTPIEKTEGCNHMTCQGCGVHICWVCMEIFASGDDCYDHLKEAHGGIYDGEGVYDADW